MLYQLSYITIVLRCKGRRFLFTVQVFRTFFYLFFLFLLQDTATRQDILLHIRVLAQN